MTKVFLGGSRKISRINADLRQRLDRLIDNRLEVVVGDANGADKAVQGYLRSKNYNCVEVFCSGRICRNNIGHWPVRTIAADNRKGREFYSIKDQAMAEEAAYGLMIWDGKSLGTLMNVLRMVDRNKTVVVYVNPAKAFLDIKSEADFYRFVDNYAADLRAKLEDQARSELKRSRAHSQLTML